MFSEITRVKIEQAYEERLKLLGDFSDIVNSKIKKLDPDCSISMKYLYSAMPISDTFDCSFDTILDYAEHAVWLRKNSAFSKKISDELFLNYILMHRINNEKIDSCRSFFHAQIETSFLEKGLSFKNLTMEETAIEINYWCSEHVVYQAGDDRTASPLAVFRSGVGRCGEESAFTVAALRSFGLPARQVYAPRWSHCDDNHAWVEVWCDGKWRFMGACEPEPVLDHGWFIHAAARAMLVHSRTYGDISDGENSILIEKKGIERYQNQLSRYAKTVWLKVKVVDNKGKPVHNVRLDLCVLNFAEMFPLASIMTDENGQVFFETAAGSLFIQAISQDNKKVQKFIEKVSDEEIILNIDNQKSRVNYCYSKNSSKEFTFFAPSDSEKTLTNITDSIKKESERKLAASQKKYKDKELAWKLGLEHELDLIRINEKDRSMITDILVNARSNWQQIVSFIKTAQQLEGKNKEEISADLLSIRLLKQLNFKDIREYSCQLLLDHLIPAIKLDLDSKNGKLSLKEQAFLDKYILCPRIYFEPITSWRLFIESWFSEKLKKKFKENPSSIYKWLFCQTKISNELCATELLTSPESVIKHDIADPKSIDICFIAICRTLGIAARIDPVKMVPQYWQGGRFIDAGGAAQLKNEKAELILNINKDDEKLWQYKQNLSIAWFYQGHYFTLGSEFVGFENQNLEFYLNPGEYRLITCERLPNGNQTVNMSEFIVTAEEKKEINLLPINFKIEDILEKIILKDIEFIRSNVLPDSLTIMIWIEEGREPTEHILNELRDRAEKIKEANIQIVLLAASKEAQNDRSVIELIRSLPETKFRVFDFSNLESLARRVYKEPGMLPLIMTLKSDCTVIYSASGYNVGTADLLLKIAEKKERKV